MSRAPAFLLRAAWVVPVTCPPIRDGGVLVVNRRIRAIGQFKQVQREAPYQAQRVEFPDGILMPGLVNPHTHLENTHFADYIKRPQSFNQWLRQMVRLVRTQTFDDALAAARDGIEQLLKAGVTCVGEFSRLGASFVALREKGLRGVVFKEFICLRDENLDERMSELIEWLQVNERYESERLQIAVGPHAPYTVTPKAFQRVLEWAKSHCRRWCVHAAESPAERELVEHRKGFWRLWLGRVLRDVPKGFSPIRYLDWLSVLQEGALLVHCVQVDERDIALLAERKVWVVHCPRSNANLKVGIMPLRAMREAGVRVCLATDGLASADSLSPLDEIRFARQLARQFPDRYPNLPPDEWLRMVTINAASALGMADLVGSLEVGKFADIAVFTVDTPIADPYEALLDGHPKIASVLLSGTVKLLHR